MSIHRYELGCRSGSGKFAVPDFTLLNVEPKTIQGCPHYSRYAAAAATLERDRLRSKQFFFVFTTNSRLPWRVKESPGREGRARGKDSA